MWTLLVECQSFKHDTCPESKIRGEFDFREDWVVELREADYINLIKCTDKQNLADIFTKCMGPSAFHRRVQQIKNYTDGSLIS